MTEQLSPEQRAYKALADNRARFGYRHIPNRDRELASDIAAAIRAAQAAAVEAERDRCAKVADEWHEWYEKPGSGTRHALRIAHHIRNPAEASHDR